jgi:hypothetical protein
MLTGFQFLGSTYKQCTEDLVMPITEKNLNVLVGMGRTG